MSCPSAIPTLRHQPMKRHTPSNLRNHCGVRRISGNLPGRGASCDCGAAAQKSIQRRCRMAMHAEHADASVQLHDRRSRIRYRRTRVAGIESHAEPRPCPHPRVLRASPYLICAEILALGCRGPMLAHPLPGPRRRSRFWRYTLALRVYGAPFWLRPTAARRGFVPSLLRESRCTDVRPTVMAGHVRAPSS